MTSSLAPARFAVAALLGAGGLLVACSRDAASQNAMTVPKQDGQPTASMGVGMRGDGVPAFWVRPGYKVTLAGTAPEARFMVFDDKGVLYLSRPNHGDIMSFRYKDGKLTPLSTFVSGYRTAHGLSFHGGWVYFTQSTSVHRAKDTNGDGKADETEVVIPDSKLPQGGGHWWRSILVTDDALYTSIGDSGNISDQTTTERQKIWKFTPDGSSKTLVASGIRNTEKLLFRPGTTELWGCDHGSDWFGKPIGDKDGDQPITDLNPPDELNRYEGGKFYGHPFVTGFNLPRVEYHNRPDIIELVNKNTPPEWAFGAHWATNGFCFLTTNALGADHKGDAFVGCHGSWNRKRPAGYRIERVLFDEVTGKPYGGLMIVGTLDASGSNPLGRPVDCCEAPDGSVLFTDDMTGRIYRISKS